MSADLYTSEIDESRHGFLSIEMNVHDYLTIVVGDPSSHETAAFNLPANEEGWKEVENIISSLQEWVRHSKEMAKEE